MIGNKQNYILLNRRVRRRRVQRAYSSIRVYVTLLYIYYYFLKLYFDPISRERGCSLAFALDRDRQRCSGGEFYTENILKKLGQIMKFFVRYREL